MLRVLLREVRDGRLRRLPYLGYGLLLGALMAMVGFMLVVFLGGAATLTGADLQETQTRIGEHLGPVGVPLLAILGLGFGFAALNLQAKRLRDMGLPGWLTLAGIVLLEVGLSLAIAPQIGSVVNGIIWLALLLVPSNAFGGSGARAVS